MEGEEVGAPGGRGGNDASFFTKLKGNHPSLSPAVPYAHPLLSSCVTTVTIYEDSQQELSIIKKERTKVKKYIGIELRVQLRVA